MIKLLSRRKFNRIVLQCWRAHDYVQKYVDPRKKLVKQLCNNSNLARSRQSCTSNAYIWQVLIYANLYNLHNYRLMMVVFYRHEVIPSMPIVKIALLLVLDVSIFDLYRYLYMLIFRHMFF